MRKENSPPPVLIGGKLASGKLVVSTAGCCTVDITSTTLPPVYRPCSIEQLQRRPVGVGAWRPELDCSLAGAAERKSFRSVGSNAIGGGGGDHAASWYLEPEGLA
jgi:hypothetical protein